MDAPALMAAVGIGFLGGAGVTAHLAREIIRNRQRAERLGFVATLNRHADHIACNDFPVVPSRIAAGLRLEAERLERSTDALRPRKET